MLNGTLPLWVPIAAAGAGILLFIAAPWLTTNAQDSEKQPLQLIILRGVLIAFIALQVADLMIHQTLEPYYNRLLLKSSLTVLATVVTMVVFNLGVRLFNAKFGKTRSIDGTEVSVASYHSRMASVVLLTLLAVMLVYVLIEIWGLESLLEKTGFIGVIAAFLVLTSAVWLPDVFYGVVLLGSSMAEEGDTISLPGDDRLFIVHRLTPFYALLLDVDNNHRVMLKNAELFQARIENLSKRASVEGLRRALEFKLGYPETAADGHAGLELFIAVDEMVKAAFERAAADKTIYLNVNVPFEWSLVEAGDNALRFVVYFHLSALPETKLTSRIRAHLRTTRNAIVRLIFEEASARGLNLATPSLLKIDAVTNSATPPSLERTRSLPPETVRT
ncbi:MAG: hypothetical protein V2I51_17385 [Anderseniella sp.]|jgi:hypothetical protein|nr:hypothetical protein [Anderseniella sp.]